MKKSARILIVGNGGGVSNVEARVAALGYGTCAVALQGTQAAEPEPGAPPDLALVDLGCSAEDAAAGVAAGGRAARRYGVPVVYLAGDADDELLQRMWRSAPAGCVSKPFEDRQLRLSIDGALAAHGRRPAARGRDPEEPAGSQQTAAGLRERCEWIRGVRETP